jgi:hypothetical protein
MRYTPMLLVITLLVSQANGFPSGEGVSSLQVRLSNVPLGQRIAIWAEEFVGTPYDPDPMGEYVTRKTIVTDERVDCMYHTFRSVELALSTSPEEAVAVALRKRFKDSGVIENGAVANYDNRFQYGMDMLLSGKWGTDITGTLGNVMEIEGSRGISTVGIIPASRIRQTAGELRSGDIVFFVKDPEKRIVGEIIGHIGIIKREGDAEYLIHASGRKNRGGEVVKTPLSDYISYMPFVGIIVSRF